MSSRKRTREEKELDDLAQSIMEEREARIESLSQFDQELKDDIQTYNNLNKKLFEKIRERYPYVWMIHKCWPEALYSRTKVLPNCFTIRELADEYLRYQRTEYDIGRGYDVPHDSHIIDDRPYYKVVKVESSEISSKILLKINQKPTLISC